MVQTLRFPAICGSCGKAPAQDRWEFTSKVKRTSAVTALTIFAGVLVSNVYTFRIPVAVCATCKTQMENDRQLRRTITYVFAGIAVVSLLVGTLTTAPWLGIGWIGFGLSLLVLVIARSTLDHKLSSFDGQYLRFTNRAYETEFRALNPALVKPTRK